MIFQDYMTTIAARMREPEMATQNFRLQVDLPYIQKSELEEILVMSLNQVLREVKDADLSALTSQAVEKITGGDALAAPWSGWSVKEYPKGTLRALAASVDNQPAIESSLAALVQMGATKARYTSGFAFWGDHVIFHGTSIALTLLVEPTATEWKTATTSILPPGYDSRVIDQAVSRIQISDYVPMRG